MATVRVTQNHLRLAELNAWVQATQALVALADVAEEAVKRGEYPNTAVALIELTKGAIESGNLFRDAIRQAQNQLKSEENGNESK